jgi:hypothetical protein
MSALRSGMRRHLLGACILYVILAQQLWASDVFSVDLPISDDTLSIVAGSLSTRGLRVVFEYVKNM